MVGLFLGSFCKHILSRTTIATAPGTARMIMVRVIRMSKIKCKNTYIRYVYMYVYIYTITIINITQVYPSIVFILASTSLPSQHSSKSDVFRLSFQRDPTKPIVTIDGNPIIWWPCWDPTNPRFCRAQWLKASIFRAVHNLCKNPNYILQLQTILPDGNSPLVKPPHKNFPNDPTKLTGLHRPVARLNLKKGGTASWRGDLRDPLGGEILHQLRVTLWTVTMKHWDPKNWIRRGSLPSTNRCRISQPSRCLLSTCCNSYGDKRDIWDWYEIHWPIGFQMVRSLIFCWSDVKPIKHCYFEGQDMYLQGNVWKWAAIWEKSRSTIGFLAH